MTKRAIFFDKDGVLNLDNGISGTASQAQLMDNASDVVASIRKKGYEIFVVTNQPIVARGILSENDLKVKLDEFQELLLAGNDEAKILKIFYCPHHPNANIEQYRQKCDCRKPGPGMLLRAAELYKIDLKDSYMVGDRISDIIAGHLAGCTTIQMVSDRSFDYPIESHLDLPDNIVPMYTINHLNELLEIVK